MPEQRGWKDVFKAVCACAFLGMSPCVPRAPKWKTARPAGAVSFVVAPTDGLKPLVSINTLGVGLEVYLR